MTVHSFPARYQGTCDQCDSPILPGDVVAYDDDSGLIKHADCPDPLPKGPGPGEVWCQGCFLVHPIGECDLDG